MVYDKMLQDTTVRILEPVEAAWVGALIEGEGHIAAHPSHYQHTRPVLTVAMVDIEPIATLLRLVGDGGVYYGPPRTRRQAQWKWSIQRKKALRKLLPQIIPFLASKREAAQQVLESVS